MKRKRESTLHVRRDGRIQFGQQCFLVLCSDWLYPDLDIQVYREDKLFDEGQTSARNGHMGTQFGGLHKIVPPKHKEFAAMGGLWGSWFNPGDRIIINITPQKLFSLIKLLRGLEREVFERKR